MPTMAAPPINMCRSLEELEEGSITPWYTYMVTDPVRPLPAPADRPHLHTEHLLIRPLFPSDLEAFHRLRSDAELQRRSMARGRPE